MNADAVAALRALFEDITFADRDAICVNCGSGWGEHTNACPVTVFRAALADASDAPHANCKDHCGCFDRGYDYGFDVAQESESCHGE